MKVSLAAVTFVMVAFLVHFSHSGPVKRLKFAKVSGDAPCPPGVWTCSTGKRSEIGRAAQENEKELVKSEEEEACPPGIWVCRKGSDEPERENTATKETLNTTLKRASKLCPPGIWTCDESHELLREMLEDARKMK